MPRFEVDVDSCDHITADAIGQPGQRVFYLHAWQAARAVTVIVEKIQLQSLAVSLEQFLAQLAVERPELGEVSAEYSEEKMRITPPVEPVFRVGEIGLGYDPARDLVVIITHEILVEGDDAEEAAVVRFWCSRPQALALARWSSVVVQRGRPICTQCGQPIDPAGHFCPKKNGHR